MNRKGRRTGKIKKKSMEQLDAFGSAIVQNIMQNVLPILGRYDLRIFESLDDQGEKWVTIMFREVKEKETVEPEPKNTIETQ